jgi:tetratricopeptide (TPR) repeat protein
MVFAASNLKKDRLGESLVAQGRISQSQFEAASQLMRGARRRRFGEALVQAGVMDVDELGRSVARQVKRIVLSLFDLPEGVASFEERECSIPLEYMVSLSVHRLLYQGIRQMPSRELVLAGLGSLDRWVTLAAVPPFRFGLRKCGTEELEILEQAKRRVTLRRLAWSAGELSLSRLRSVYALLASGVLEEADKEEGRAEPQPVVQMETSTFLLSALRHQPDASARDLIRKEIDEELKRSARMDRQTWLRLARTAPPEELVKALEEKMERYHELLDAVRGDEPLETDIELILGRASSMLRMARQTVQAAQQPAPAQQPAATAVAPPAAERPRPVADARPDTKPVPVVRDVPLPAPKPAAAPAPAQPGPVAPPAPVPSSAAVAPVVPAAPPEPAPEAPAPADGRATPPAGVAPASDAPPRPTPPAEATTSSHSTFTGRAQIEHLMVEAQVRMTVGDYAAAVDSYSRLVELVPHEPAPRVRLAIAMACYPRTAKQAEREFLEAVRLAPDNADIHYHFGLYYKAMKVRARALAEFRTVLSLNPRHQLARQELESLSPKDSALTTLRKLFR